MNSLADRRRNFKFPALFCLLLFMGLLGASACSPESPPSIRLVSQAEVSESLGDASAPLLLDVRTPAEFERGHIPGAVLVPDSKILESLEELRRDSQGRGIVIYCESGGRALRTASTLVTEGFTNVGHLDGDMLAWRRAGLPTEP